MATDITAFPTITNVLVHGSNVGDFIASGAITAGQVVAFDATGVTDTVRMAIAEAGECPVGVALFSVTAAQATAGAHVAVGMLGTICRVSNYSSDVDIDAGEPLTTNDAAPGGTVIAASGAATQELVGRAMEDSDASNLEGFKMLVLCGVTSVIHA
jgi:hypothetical protein